MPKGGELHEHYSSCIDYEEIFRSIKETDLSRYLYYNSYEHELFFRLVKDKKMSK